MQAIVSRLHGVFWLWVCMAVCSPLALADTQYQTSEEFVREALPGAQPQQPAVIWLDKNLQAKIAELLGHPYPQARLRYWRQGAASVWVLDEIGKEYPITAGFWVNNAKIARAQVLTYRETRGWEIHLPAFLKQFVGSELKGGKLTTPVDGIAGATLSVNAMTKMAKVALLLDNTVQTTTKPPP